MRRLARPATARTSRAPDPPAPTAQRICSLPGQVLTHSWDGSQTYGVDALGQDFLREHSSGRLRMENGPPPHSTAPSKTQPASPSSGRHWSPGKPRSPNTKPQRSIALSTTAPVTSEVHVQPWRRARRCMSLALPGRCCSDVLQWTEKRAPVADPLSVTNQRRPRAAAAHGSSLP